VPVLLLILRLLLACVFAAAAAGKLADRPGARAAASGFGVPAALAGTVAVALPIAELAVAVLFVPVATAPVAAVAALALLVVFGVAIAAAIARHEAPDCHCFGALHSAPAGPATLARNAGLALVAGAVLTGTPLSATAWIGDLTGPERAALAVAAVALAIAAGCAALAWQLLRAHGRLLRRIDRLEAGPSAALPPAGEPAPDFALASLGGGTVTLDRLRRPGSPVLLVFSDPNCGPCRALLPVLATWQRRLARRLSVAVVSTGDAERVRAEAAEHGLANVLLAPDRAVSQAYGAAGTPSAVLIDADGRRRGAVAAGQPAIQALVDAATGGAAPPVAAPVLDVVPPRRMPTPGPNVGDAVGPIDLPTLDGGRFTLARPALLISWNPGCGFCRRMLEPLRAALAAAPDGAPDVVLLARGDREANRALDLPGIVAIDENGTVAQALGAGGTPIGVLLDEQRRVAAGPAVGADAALALLGEPTPVA
jgi:thiol-disulfide isomerase/thioredoxin